MSTDHLLVTGAAGHLGRRVVELLLEQGVPRIIATTRDPAKLADLAARGVDVRRADFDDATTLPAAFAGVTRALVVSTDALGRAGQRIAQHRAAIRALVDAGARHIVYTSLPNPVGSPSLVAPDHAATEAALADVPVDVTVLRNNLYTDHLLGALPGAVATGRLVHARGDARIAYVTREDCARAAAAALAKPRPGRTTVDVTGPEALGAAELASLAGELAGRPVEHLSVAPAALVEGMAAHGVPRMIAELLTSFDAAASRGDYAQVSSTVRDLGGAEPMSVRAFLSAHRDALLAR